MRGDGISTHILDYLRTRPNQRVTVKEIAEAIGREPNNTSVSLSYLLRTCPEVQRVSRGWYSYQTDEPVSLTNGHVEAEPEPEPLPEEVDLAEQILARLEPVKSDRIRAESRKRPEANVETITPEIAERWLTANVKNRDLRMGRVLRYAGILVREEWFTSQDGIGFDTAGYLMNGQHRLSGIIVSGIPAELVIVRGLKPEAQHVMDQALTRSLGDILKMQGRSHYNHLAASLSWLYRFAYINETGSVHYSNPGGQRPTTSQLLAIFEANPEIEDLPRLVVSRIRRYGVPLRTGLMSALWHIFGQIDTEEADLFVKQLGEGAGLAQTDAVLVLRNTLIQDTRRSFQRMPDYREAALIIKAWNAFREAKPVDRITYKYGAVVKEPFPRPI